uniref:Phospholipase D-like domain-containing protein n=1 Tax=Acanthochromis polyacanthus TaxID=80966 RepID=A0A3Q1EPX1_9TELE
MVKLAFVFAGTSNWSENYFTHTAGVGLVVNQTDSVVEKGQQTLQSQAEDLFLRDWGSSYSSWLASPAGQDCCKYYQFSISE